MLTFVTGNAGKVREARRYLDQDVEQVSHDYVEIQSPDLAAIAARGAREAYAYVGGPVFVEDSGLFVEDLDGFPGPYSAYVEDTIGIEGVAELGAGSRATFRSVIAFCDGDAFARAPPGIDEGEGHTIVASVDAPVALLVGEVTGEIVQPRGSEGFGYDPIFEFEGETFAERSMEAKNEVSHRGRALEAFADWLA
ncbi:non-canonical purine NTP pyrophosphatase [Halococcoides cellulosivorans]|uniref:Non-canonical purine NTP pyrophosphatase n=1 Tax=Halococcoides cellulosivorans TaxID=1679096 RepID=A0A2R4X397_9EURY|nr:non-canonical purine NTP pyrophosphatase [Halococcoides cellulosivorans]AWB28262.1 non-canonical purine NTP pyrophosphatase [Halococcoides cellulosivorans]